MQEMTSWICCTTCCGRILTGWRVRFVSPSAKRRGWVEVYEYGHLVKNVNDLENQVQIEYTNRDGNVEKATAVLVIGAHRPNFPIRKVLLPDVSRFYMGYVAKSCTDNAYVARLTPGKYVFCLGSRPIRDDWFETPSSVQILDAGDHVTAVRKKQLSVSASESRCHR